MDTDSEVNAAIAATIAERLDLYRKQLGIGTPAAFAVETIMSKAAKENWVTGDQLDADRIISLQERLAELERFASKLASYQMPPADDSKEYAWQNRLYAIRTDARKLMGVEDQ